MTRAARSIVVFGVYMIALGVVLLVAPNLLLGLFGIPATTDMWVRIAGMLVLFLGVYYILAARQGLTGFFRWTVYIRSSVIVFFAAFVLLSFAPPVLVLFGFIDLLGAIWTALALRSASGM